MYRKFLNARSPMRLLEKGLHGGLGIGNIGLVIAGRGVGKSSFLVGVALDELLRGGRVMHVSLDQTVSHVRTYYDTVFETLVSVTHLEDAVVSRSEIDRSRSIRSYPESRFLSRYHTKMLSASLGCNLSWRYSVTKLYILCIFHVFCENSYLLSKRMVYFFE